MKRLIIFLCAASKCLAALSLKEANVIANAIYKIEGGNHTKYPYGIKSINVKDSFAARTICINTILNNHKRWIAANKPIDFLDYLANAYCPKSCDAIGNKNWKTNIHKFFPQKIH